MLETLATFAEFYLIMIQKLNKTKEDHEHIARVSINPRDLEDDFFDYSRVVIKKPWGKEYLIYRNDDAALWVLHMNKGAKTSMHCHPNKKTALVVLSGQVKCATLNSEKTLKAGQGSLIEKGVFHSTEALDPEDVVVMELETPTNKRDLIRLNDAYGRSGKGYEGTSHHVPLDDSLCHFHKVDDRYHCEKKFGNCVLSVAKFSGAEDLQKKLELQTADIVTVLKGDIFIPYKNIAMTVGDTMMWDEFKDHAQRCTVEEGELLFIKKIA